MGINEQSAEQRPPLPYVITPHLPPPSLPHTPLRVVNTKQYMLNSPAATVPAGHSLIFSYMSDMSPYVSSSLFSLSLSLSLPLYIRFKPISFSSSLSHDIKCTRARAAR